MPSKRIKKPVRKKKKSDYPGEMSFRKALGMNPTYYQEGGKLYYQEDNNIIPSKFNPQMFQPNEVKYGTPEYEQAYNQGTLTTRLSGDAENAPLRARMLPEFKVTPEYKSLSDDLRYLAINSPKEIPKWGAQGMAEFIGIPGAVKFLKNPKQGLKGAGNTIVDLGLMAGAGLSPVGRFGQMNPMGGMQYATQGTNSLTGEGSFRAEDVEGAFNTLDAVGIATIAGSALKAPLQQGAKQLAKSPVVDYAKEFGHSIKKGKLPTYESIYRWQPDVFPKSLVEAGKTLTPLQQGLTGSWYTKYPGQLSFYMRARPGAGNVNRIRLSDRQIANLESSMPDYAKGMSGKSGVNRVSTSNTFMPGELIVPESIRSKSVPMRFQVNPIDYSPQSVADEITKRRSKLKNVLNSPYFLSGDIDRTIKNEVIEEHAKNIYTPMLKAQEQPILGIPRKYFPFQDGGSLPKAQMLGQFNPQMFQPNPITGLYNWEKPKVKPQLTDFEPKQKAAERASTNVATKQDPVKAARQINATAAEEYERNRGVIRSASVPASSYFKPGGYDPMPLAELTGVPSMARIAQNPESINDFLTGVDQLVLGSSPVSGMMGMRREFTPEEIQAMSDYSTVASMAAPLAKGAVNLGAQGLRQASRYATTQTPLRNARKLNPFAENLNNPNKSYRVAGEDAYQDFLNTGVVQSADGKLSGLRDVLPDGRVIQIRRPTGFPSFQKGYADLSYADPSMKNYIYETSVPTFKRGEINPVTGERIKGRHYAHRPIDMNTGEVITQLPAKDVRVFESTPHWLKGYKPIEVPRQLPGSPNAGKSFKSEIDWRNWVKYKEDFDNNPQVIQELIDIEKTSKANGTWMKNPDGSPFQGSPEQFVTQQSSNFKKAFPNILKDSKGNTLRVNHGSPENFTEFNKNKFSTTTDMGDKGVGTYVTPLDYSKNYGDNQYNLYVNAKSPLNASSFIDPSIPPSARAHLADKDLRYFHRDVPEKYKNRVNQYLDRDIVIGDEFYPNVNENAFEMVVPFNNRMKSAIGNILFDMTNPNIYKSLAPIMGLGAAGTYGVNQLMNQQQQQMRRFGGKLRYARGGSLTSAQDTAQAADLNKDIMRKDIKKASAGEDFMAGLYGVGEGLVDTLTFGLTDDLTDAGFKALQAGAGHDVNSVEAKRQAGIKGWGNVGGAVTGAFINPASAFSAGQEGLEGIGQGIQGINPEDKTLQAVGKGVEGLGNIQLPKGMKDMEGMSKLFMARNGGKFKYGYRGGGHMLNQNMGLTEIDGPSHEEGGVTLPNSGGRPDVEVEGPETIYTPENYVMSEKMKASLEALEFAGITGKSAKRLAGKSYADLSKMIKSKAGDKLRPNDPLSKKMLDKEMKKLMRAHEYDREAKRMQEEAMRTQMMGGSNVVAETPEQRAGGYNMYPNAQSIEFPGSGQTSVVPTYNNDPIMVTGADGSQQMLTDEPIETEAPFIEEKMAQGGKMIKRADGSYSKRGLWDNIRANRGSGKKPTKQMLEQEAKIKAAEKAYGGYYADGGSFNNPGFRALPSYVQAKIKSNMALGGDMAGLGMEDESLMQGASSFLNPITQTLNNVADIESQENEYQMQLGGYMGDYISDDDTMEYGEGGYTVRKSNDRKGKTHVVTGPDGTKKYFGDPKLGERGKSKYGKDAFYARHKKNLDKNPYFRAYARATWEDGGYMNMLNSNVDMADMQAPMYKYGGSMKKMGNFAPMNSGYMYQMGGEMMQAPQQGQPQGQPQGGGGEEQILQQVAQMLQQGMSPEEIVGQLVQMGVPQEQAIQVVQMVVQQMQGQQQAPQEAPQQAPPMMRGGGYMYQMGGEMAPQQAPQQQAPQQQAQGGEEQIVQAIMQMLQQGMQPEEIVGELVKMGLPQEAAIQAVQMVMQQSQQGQQGQQQQMPTEAPAPMMRYGGRVTKQMGGSLADNYLSQVNQYPVLKRNGGKLYYQQEEGFMPKVYIPGAYTPPTSIGFDVNYSENMIQPEGVKNNYERNSSEFDVFPSKQDFKNIKASPGSLNNYRRDPSLFKIPLGTPSGDTTANNTPQPPLPTYESPMGNYIAGGLGSMFGPLANAAAAAFAPDPTYTAAPKFKKFDYTPVALQRAAGNQAMANTRQAIRMGAPTQGSYLANVGVAMPSAGAQIGTQLAQTRYGIDSQNIGLINQESQLRAAQAEKNALMKDQSISNRWKLGMEAAAGTGRNIQGFSKDMGAKGMQDQLLNQLRTGDFAVIGYDNVNGTLVPKLAPAGVATYNDGTITAPNGQRLKWNTETNKYEPI
jgi:hypothetical protein